MTKLSHKQGRFRCFWLIEATLLSTFTRRCNSTADTLACLRTVNVSTLATVDSYLAGTAFYGSYIWAPVVDGTFITERPTVTLANGKVNGVSDMDTTDWSLD